MQIGERWAYREPPYFPGKPCTLVEVLQFGPPKRNKVRIRLVGGEYPGLDLWVPKGRLRVPWEQSDAYLADERRYAAVAAASRQVHDTVEHHAAWLALFAYHRPDGILMEDGSANAGVVEIADLDAVLRDLSLERQELFADPLAYVDRRGAYVGPWSAALRLAKRVAAVYPESVLDRVREEEQGLEEAATRGKTLQWGRNDPPVHVPAERWVEDLHRKRPVFSLARAWCGTEHSSAFDEAKALRAEVERLQELVLEAARRLKDAGHPVLASRLHKEVGADSERRS